MASQEEPATKKRRGPYKKYLRDSDIPVPESTLRSLRSRQQRETDKNDDEEQTGSDETLINQDVGADEALINQDENVSEQEPSQEQSSNLCENVDAEISNNTPVGQQSISPHHSIGAETSETCDDPNADEDQADEDMKQGVNYIKKYDLNRPLHLGFLLTAPDTLLIILHLAIRHCHTQHFVEDLIAFVNILFGTMVLDISYHIFKNLFPSSQEILRHYFCPDCEIYLGSGETLKGVKEKVCSGCKKAIDVSSVDSGNYFISLSVKEQIEALLKRPDIKLIDHKDRLVDGIRDIFDGDIFKKCHRLGIAIEQVLTLIFNTDGVRVHNSTKNTMWPILAYINEIVPEQRFQTDKVLLCGLWFGRSAPNMALFLKPFMNQLLQLSETGVTNCKSDGTVVKYHVFPIGCSVDSVAKPKPKPWFVRNSSMVIVGVCTASIQMMLLLREEILINDFMILPNDFMILPKIILCAKKLR
ncbi:hypothetical protein ONE63_007284 [Megalurothrips usitatus]|uniref:Uncharacterized protein n=1 Tax=Megalurothrips usitatus TaxID=439358 RepID=A0AAV7XVM4_9NEOP|nr:hypothetical protein ONE63_007284 [Megalurothrips usitatus]